MKLFEGEQQTGRTTRILEHAIERAQQGRAVYVVGIDQLHVSNLRRLAEDIYEKEEAGVSLDRLGIKFETVASLRGYNPLVPQARPVGVHPNCLMYPDHYLLEQMITHAVQEIERWSAEYQPSEGEPDKQGTECPGCGGTGLVWPTIVTEDGDFLQVEAGCFTCDETGRVNASEP